MLVLPLPSIWGLGAGVTVRGFGLLRLYCAMIRIIRALTGWYFEGSVRYSSDSDKGLAVRSRSVGTVGCTRVAVRSK